MLHQPASTFEPSLPAAQPFDVQRYLARAHELNLTVFPTISREGEQMYGITACSPNIFSEGNRLLAEEFNSSMRDAPDGVGAIFDALCADFDVDPADPAFNERVNAICRLEGLRRQGDRKLIAICRRAEKIVAEDLRLEDRLSDLDDSFMLSSDAPKRPEGGGVCRYLYGSSQEMRAEVRKHRAKTSPEDMRAMTAYIKEIAAWERCRKEAKDRHGLTAAKRAAAAANRKTYRVVAEIVSIEATTLAGVAAKSRAMNACLKAGYGMHDEFEDLAKSIFHDAARLGEDRAKERSPSAQVH